MNLRERRIKFLQDVITNGKTKTWVEYADDYNLASSKQASDFYRYYQRTGNIVPDLIQEEIEETKSSDTVDYSIPEGAIVTGGWVKNSKQSIRFTIPQEETKALEDNLVETLKEYSPVYPELVSKEDANYAVMLSIPDLHYGKGPLEETSMLFKGAVAELISRFNTEQIEKFILPLGNDILNSEGNTRATTKGTPQWDSAEPWDVFNKALTDCIDVITWLSTIAPVEVVCVHGNHDRMTSYYLFRSLEGYMDKNENVTITNDVEARNYLQYGNTGFLLDHGEIKPEQYPNIFATEQPKLWGEVKYREAILGHKHHQDTKEFRGFIVRYLPALCANDKWHKDNAYVGSHRAAQAYKYHKEAGFIGMEECRVII